MEREGNMAEINPGITETRTEIPPLPGYSRLTFQAENSIRKIDVPDDPLAQRKMLTDTMQLLESTQEENGNLAYSNANKTFVLMIQAMQQNGEKGPNDKKFDYNYAEQVKKLVDEHQARTAFHATFVAYETANDVGNINKALAQFKSEWLNKLFTDEKFRAFRYALEYYMDNGKNFVGMNEISAKAKQAIPELETQTEFRNKANSFVEEASKKWEGKPSKAEIESMRNLAERFWIISGTRMAQTQTFTDTEAKVKDINGEDIIITQEDWVDKAVSGGNFQVRDAIRFKERVTTRAYQLRPHMDVFADLEEGEGINKEIDLDSKDFLAFMKSAFDKNKIKLNFTDDKFWEGANGQPAYNFDNLANRKDPLGSWSFRNLVQTEEAKKVFLIYIQNPNDENFLKAAKSFDYLTDDKFKTFVKMVHHRNKFLETKEAREMGLTKPDKAGFDNMIEKWGRELKLNPEETQFLAEKFLGTGAWAELTIFWSHIKGTKALLTIFWELLFGILKEGLKQGK
ncbi:MAG: hypothetical protein Q7R97_01315 [Candidatus Daviesbacteria bacterium]|nr:hypothetical protein [Candidatus Daviesbacteria bacterium]